MTGKDNNNKIDPFAQAKKKWDAHKRIHFEQIDSTNSWAKAHTEQWSQEGVTLITAGGQTGGRGRFKRRWESPADVNIYATYCFWLDQNRTDIGHIPQLLALAAARTLEKEGFSPTIKWPNDLLLNGKKIAGILCETISSEKGRGIVCGIGFNVNMSKEILDLIDRPATSLFAESGVQWEVCALLDEMTVVFLVFLDEFIRQGFKKFFILLQERSVYVKGDAVRFHDNNRIVEARFEALHPNGSVELRLPDGTLKIYHAGEFLF